MVLTEEEREELRVKRKEEKFQRQLEREEIKEKLIEKRGERKEEREKKKTKKIMKGKAEKVLGKALKIKIKERKAEALRAEIGRKKLLQAIVSKQREGRPVNILRRVSDTIPNVLIKRRDEEIKPTFLRRGGLI